MNIWQVWKHLPAEDRQAFVHELCMRYSPLVCESLKSQSLCKTTPCDMELVLTILEARADFLDTAGYNYVAGDLRHVCELLDGKG